MFFKPKYVRCCTLGVGILMISCSSSTEAPPVDQVAGTYDATTFTLSGEVEGDVLAAGGTLTMVLSPDGTTTGTLVVPAAFNDGEQLVADMAGTYVVSGSQVTFQQAADTFVRDMTWDVGPGTLGASGAFGAVTVTVLLTRE